MEPAEVPDELVDAWLAATCGPCDCRIRAKYGKYSAHHEDACKGLAAVLTHLGLTDEFGIRVFYASTLTEERTVADTLGEALAALDRFDAQERRDVVARELIQRPVGEWREVGDDRG